MQSAARENPVAAIEAGDPGREESRVNPVRESEHRKKYPRASF